LERGDDLEIKQFPCSSAAAQGSWGGKAGHLVQEIGVGRLFQARDLIGHQWFVGAFIATRT
jgi:hypothetical protein